SVLINKDLPYGLEAQAGYLVDQVTSASGTFTTTDHPFTEYRHDLRAALHMKIGDVTPGINARLSLEPDYTSRTIGADCALALDRDTPVFRTYLQGQFDDVKKRNAGGTVAEEIDPAGTLHTVFAGISLTQVLDRNFIAGASIESQFLRGYQANPY